MTNSLFDLPNENILVDGKPYIEEVFKGVIGELEDMSENEAQLSSLGKLSDILPGAEFKGTISVSERLKSGGLTDEQLAGANETIAKSYVPVTKGANLRCVDGRGVAGFDGSDPSSYELGPQVQGGTPDIAVARRLRKGMEPGANLLQDIDEAVEATSSDFAPGGHTDDKAPEGDYGCGAVKTQENKLEYYAQTELLAKMAGVVGVVYQADGKQFDTAVFSNLPKNASKLIEVKDEYYKDKPECVDFLTKFSSKAKQIVSGKHNEVAVMLNFVRGTTLNSSKLNESTGGEVQAFGLDVWYIIDEFKDDAPFILLDALTTLQELTDGSLEVQARTPVALSA